MQHVGDILEVILKKRHIAVPIEDQKLQALWRKVVGPKIAAQTLPERIRRKVLFVQVSSPPWLHQLQFLKDDIVTKFNDLSGTDAITSVRFSIGAIVIPTAKESAFRSEKLRDKDKRTIERCLAELPDPELKQILRQAMTREMTRRRAMEDTGKGR